MGEPLSAPILSLTNVSKHFDGLTALSGVSVEFYAGEIHAILGENGAGKTTLMRVIYGLVQPDSGSIRIDGKAVSIDGPAAARRFGIGMVHQEFALVDALSAVENLALVLSPTGAWKLERKRIETAARHLAREVGLEVGDYSVPVGDLPVGTRQRIEILKALAGRTRILILDEPTAVLTPGESAQLFRALTRLRERGAAILFITHKLREVLEIADRVTVLRRGQRVATQLRHELNEQRLAEMMMGEELTAVEAATGKHAAAPLRLVIEGLRVEDKQGVRLRNVSVRIEAGEIFGIAGVDGNGQQELFEALAGLRPASGDILVDGVSVRERNTASRIAAGFAFIPPDRQRQGLAASMTVAENALLNRAALARVAPRGWLAPARMRAAACELIERYTIRAASEDALAATLSGGNQQKLVLARALATEPRVLVAFNPARGLDIGSAHAVYRGFREAARGGTAILLISTELEELILLSNRIAVLFRGRLSEPLERPFSVNTIGQLMAGITPGAAVAPRAIG